MNELVHDLTSALEESELKIEIDNEAVTDAAVRKRNKKHRINNLHICFNDMKTGAKLLPCHDLSKKQYGLIEQSHSGSDTECSFALPMIRKHRRKKTRRMETDPVEGTHNVGKRKLLTKTMNNMDLEIPNDYGCKSLKQFGNKADDESEISTSEESDGDGQDGDDEMTDYYNEAGDGIVWGIPHLNMWKENNLMESLRLKGAVNGAVSTSINSKTRGFHSRINRFPGMAARSIRSGRRRFKYKLS